MENKSHSALKTESETDKDINDIFDSIAFTEQAISNEGFQEGFPRGEVEGKIDGYHLGFHRGLQIGREIGFYEEVIGEIIENGTSLLKSRTDKITLLLNKLKELINKFPMDNPENVDILCCLSDIRTNFKKLTSLLKLKLSFQLDENLWERLIPENIRNELNCTENLKRFVKIYPEIIKSGASDDFARDHPNLMNYLKKVLNLSISNSPYYLKSVVDLENIFFRRGCHLNDSIKIKNFMSVKKLHEVDVTSRVAASVSKLTNASHIIDVGGGNGYLSWILVLNYFCKVVSLDVSHLKTCRATIKSERVADSWKNEIFKGSEENTKSTRREFVRSHYKAAVAYVTPDTDVLSIVREHFSEESTGVCLTGLHTCGNLASACLRIFAENPDVKSVVNVGCCYHNIREKFAEVVEETDREDDWQFPMSRFLREKNFALGRNARLLASHSLDRLTKIQEFDGSSFNSLYYRAVLETAVKAHGSRIDVRNKVGKLGKKCSSFHEYMIKAAKILDLDVTITEKYTTDLYETHLNLKPLLASFFFLRVSLAPIVESIVLLDRYLYLLEKGIRNAYLIKMFDLEISPRGFGIVAWKGD